MNDYSQPDFYKFNSDSIDLINFIQEQTKFSDNILDLCAGCGVIGIELAKYYQVKSVVFVEAQNEFFPYLAKNSDSFIPNIKREILIQGLSEFNPDVQFDLITCNPPYYLPGRGQISMNKNRSICRSFVLDGWGILFEKISASLRLGGKCYIVVKNDKQIICEIKKTMTFINFDMKFFNIKKIVVILLTRIE